MQGRNGERLVGRTTELHDERLDVACRAIRESGAKTVLDLGCGTGALLQRLVREPQFEKIVGVDKCSQSLWQAQNDLREFLDAGRLVTVLGSYIDRTADLCGFDACAMVETIEHIDPGMLGNVERTVFGYYRPKTLVMTTPNAEFNELYGLDRTQVRVPDHRFEWNRAKFRDWAAGVAERNGYRIRFSGIGDVDFLLGQPTQMAFFTLVAAA